MRMKKVIILAAVVIAAIACSKTYEVVPNASEGREIGFSTWAEQLTKARTQGTSTFAADDDFAVYGFKAKDGGADPVTVFDDVVVSTTDGSTWDYTPHRFWDHNYASYTFYAISPAAVGTAGTVDAQTGEITSAGITFAGNNNDILVADKKDVAKAAFNAPVELQFNHVASLVDFKVKKAPSLHAATVTVSAFDLSQIETAGVLTVSDAYTDTHPVVSWSSTATGAYTPAQGVNPITVSATAPVTIEEDTAFNPASPAATPASSTFLINNLVVKPQTFGETGATTSQQLSIKYKIAVDGGGEVEHESTLYLADFDTVDDADQEDSKVAGWDPGKHYTFYVTIDANVITFTAKITDWTEVSGYQYLVN